MWSYLSMLIAEVPTVINNKSQHTGLIKADTSVEYSDDDSFLLLHLISCRQIYLLFSKGAKPSVKLKLS